MKSKVLAIIANVSGASMKQDYQVVFLLTEDIGSQTKDRSEIYRSELVLTWTIFGIHVGYHLGDIRPEILRSTGC